MKVNLSALSDSKNASNAQSFRDAFQEARANFKSAFAEARSAQSDLRPTRGSSESRPESRGQVSESVSESRPGLRAEARASGGSANTSSNVSTIRSSASSTDTAGSAGGSTGGSAAGGGSSAPTAAAPEAPQGNILGGTNALGATIDPVAADFTRNGGVEPLAQLDVKHLGTTADGKERIEISQTNLSGENGTFLTPAFVGVHDGSFDVFTPGEAAPQYLEALAEDGTTDPIVDFFNKDTGGRGVSGIITGGEGAAGPLDPGETGSIILEVDPAEGRFLSFAQMVIPSNDAFVASGDDPRGIELFDEQGNFVGGQVTLDGNDVYDAGTEVNTEEDAAFINQDAPNTGIDENGVVTRHPGFIGSERQTGAAEAGSASGGSSGGSDNGSDASASLQSQVNALLAMLKRY